MVFSLHGSTKFLSEGPVATILCYYYEAAERYSLWEFCHLSPSVSLCTRLLLLLICRPNRLWVLFITVICMLLRHLSSDRAILNLTKDAALQQAWTRILDINRLKLNTSYKTNHLQYRPKDTPSHSMYSLYFDGYCKLSWRTSKLCMNSWVQNYLAVSHQRCQLSIHLNYTQHNRWSHTFQLAYLLSLFK